jgi:asparagine synthase (glutamine-hydrolysing)
MCGIAGILNFGQDSISDQTLMDMGMAIRHRGPDDHGIWNKGTIGFTHQRLSIIDTSEHGHQPMFSEDGQYTIVFNGEIYNHAEFRDELKAKGFFFRSTSDTEVLLYLYITYGETMLHRLNGMFAFAIWDNTKQELFVCRDRMGVKPFYYTKNSKSYYFASEPKAIFAAGIPKEINPLHIKEWLLYRYIAGEETLLKGIKKLLPGHWSKIKADGSIKTARWYHLGYQIKQHPQISNPEKWFEETFHSSVKYRMVADVPVGVLLSGGLDSSSIAASLHHSNYKNIHTFNIAFKNKAHDESEIAKKFSQSLHFPFHSLYLENHELFQSLNDSVYHLDEPLVHMNDPHIMAISAYAKKHVKVLLSGEGADELMGGYIRHKTFKWIGARHLIRLVLKCIPAQYKKSRLKNWSDTLVSTVSTK